MRTKAAFLIGGAIGYLIGTRGGRQTLAQVREQAVKAWQDPRVQEAVADGQQRATAFVQEKAPELREMVSGAVRQATEAARGSAQNGA